MIKLYNLTRLLFVVGSLLLLATVSWQAQAAHSPMPGNSVGREVFVQMFCTPGRSFNRLKVVHRGYDRKAMVKLFTDPKSGCFSTVQMRIPRLRGIVTRVLGKNCIGGKLEIQYLEFRPTNVSKRMAKERFIGWMLTGKNCTNV